MCLIGIPIEEINADGVETACPAFDAMHYTTLFQEGLSKVTAVLTVDTSDQGGFGVVVKDRSMKNSEIHAGPTILNEVSADGSEAQPSRRGRC